MKKIVNKKEWQMPKIKELPLKNTMGGFIKDTFEDPWSLIFGS